MEFFNNSNVVLSRVHLHPLAVMWSPSCNRELSQHHSYRRRDMRDDVIHLTGSKFVLRNEEMNYVEEDRAFWTINSLISFFLFWVNNLTNKLILLIFLNQDKQAYPFPFTSHLMS